MAAPCRLSCEGRKKLLINNYEDLDGGEKELELAPWQAVIMEECE